MLRVLNNAKVNIAYFKNDFRVALWDQKGSMPSPSKSLLEINIHTIRTGRSEVVAYQLSKLLDLNLQGWFWSCRLEVYLGDLKHEMEFNVGVDPFQRSLRVSEVGLIIIVKFATN